MTCRAAVLVLVAVTLACAAGCRSKEGATASATRAVRDGLGRTVVVPERVERVVSLAPSSTEILFALGAAQLVVGVDRYSDFPVAARSLPQLGADVDPSLERVIALRPDLVLAATTANSQKTVDTLGRLHVPCYVSRVGSLDDIYRDVAGIAEAVGRSTDGARLVGELRRRIDAVRARTRVARPTRTLVVVWSDPLIVAGRGSHIGDLLAAAGALNVVDDDDLPYPTYSLERVIARAPEAMVVGTHATGSSPPLAPLERLTTVPAARDHRIYTLDGDLLFRPGPRVVDGVEQLAALLH